MKTVCWVQAFNTEDKFAEYKKLDNLLDVLAWLKEKKSKMHFKKIFIYITLDHMEDIRDIIAIYKVNKNNFNKLILIGGDNKFFDKIGVK